MKSLLTGLTLLAAIAAAPHAYARAGYGCDARHGPHGLVCPLVRPRPIGAVCHCRPPAPPGHGYYAAVRGIVIR
jgi:hypothetical protein